ncbi:serine/arginine-rich splicing factor 7-like isoform X2 [Cimex lectularius]|uniref:Arginine/serine-rich splicing factor n=1 Tax=Cimex lectularius TaxID=79782 RepID=A0A8I6S649_CIMLE|nr:serine/arginine-rich splicing factor 7-like isoform X2 [Cimex lectularius]
MSRFRDSNPDCKIYIGDLGSSANKQDLEDAFSYYGPIRSVWIARNPPGFAFVEFDDARDAEDAVRGLDGRNVCGRRVRVEMSNGAKRRGSVRRGRPFHPEDKCYECGERGHYARDCSKYNKRSKRRTYSRSRSRSRSRDRRSRSHSRGGGTERDHSRSRSRNRSRSRSLSRSRSRSIY